MSRIVTIDRPRPALPPAEYGRLDLYPAGEGAADHERAIVRALTCAGLPPCELYPDRLRREVEELVAVIDENVALAVHRVAAATTAEEYTAARKRLTATFHELDGRLVHRRFLLGTRFTAADLRLWTLLVRYDRGYNPFAKISKLRLIDFPQLWAYARDLYQHPPFRETTDFAAISRLPESTVLAIFRDAPWRVLVEPHIADWESPHGREGL